MRRRAHPEGRAAGLQDDPIIGQGMTRRRRALAALSAAALIAVAVVVVAIVSGDGSGIGRASCRERV